MTVRMRFSLAALLALALLAAPSGGWAAEGAAAPARPTAAELLFDTPQLASTTPGEALVYDYARNASDPELGESFEDKISLRVTTPEEARDKALPDAAARDVAVDLFTGPRHRAAGPFFRVTGNPVLTLFLENHVADLSGRLKGNPRYLKNAIRAALRERAQVRPATLTVGGRSYEGWRVTITPFKGDANAARMRGLDGLTYEFDVAPNLPGAIAKIEITADTPAGRLFQEELSYDPKGS